MKIGIIDADLIGRSKHRFPNLVSMKISAFHKANGDDVSLLTTYDDYYKYDKLYLSKVFTDTDVPNGILELKNLTYGGTGFYYDEAEPLPDEIEHIMPDYHLYDEWVDQMIEAGGKRRDYIYYTDYSIGFLTRGCFRQCDFCVNKNYDQSKRHSPVLEFYDPSRPKLCFLDDNFFACGKWKEIIEEVKELDRPFQFKQGLDERLLTDDKIHELVTWKYDGNMIFAFDDINDREVIERNLRRLFELYPQFRKTLKFYVLCGYDRNGKYDAEFYEKDIQDTLERAMILAKYSALPYIMRFEKSYKSDYAGVYSAIAAWCNQPNIFKTFSFDLFCKCKGMGRGYKEYKRDWERYIQDGGYKYSTWRYLDLLKVFLPNEKQWMINTLPKDIATVGIDI